MQYRSTIGGFYIRLQRYFTTYIKHMHPWKYLYRTILTSFFSFTSKSLHLFRGRYMFTLYAWFPVIYVLKEVQNLYNYQHRPFILADFNSINLHFRVEDLACTLSVIKYTLLLLLLRSGDIELNAGPSHVTPRECNLSIFHQNIRSIRNKFEYIRDNFLDFDIICFTETKLSGDIINKSLSLEGHDCIFRKDNTNHSGGLLTYVSSLFRPTRLLNLEITLPESIWIRIVDHSKCFLICNVYRSPNTAPECWNRFETCLDHAYDLCYNIIIVRDINENQLNPSNHKFKDILCLNNLSNVINEPTRVTDCSSTLIDPIAITNTLQHLHSGIFETVNFVHTYILLLTYPKMLLTKEKYGATSMRILESLMLQ